MDDYRGPFDPDLRFEDLSREALLKLVKEYSRLYLILHGSWHSLLRERFGDRANIDLDCYQWMLSAPANAHWLCRALGIEPENVESYFKALQLDPAFPLALFDIEYELVNENHGFMTCRRCTALDAYEAEGRGHEIPMCHEEEPATFAYAALYHNPKLIVKPVKLPPRKSRDEIACRWECRIEPGFSPTDSLSRESLRARILRKTRSSGALDRDRLEAGRDWTDERVLDYWSLLPDGTRELLRTIARNPQGFPKEELLDELGIETEELSHRFGYAYLPFFLADCPLLEHPVRVLTDPWRYEMNAGLARAIARLDL